MGSNRKILIAEMKTVLSVALLKAAELSRLLQPVQLVVLTRVAFFDRHFARSALQIHIWTIYCTAQSTALHKSHGPNTHRLRKATC
jgi:hypothetical protein